MSLINMNLGAIAATLIILVVLAYIVKSITHILSSHVNPAKETTEPEYSHRTYEEQYILDRFNILQCKIAWERKQKEESMKYSYLEDMTRKHLQMCKDAQEQVEVLKLSRRLFQDMRIGVL